MLHKNTVKLIVVLLTLGLAGVFFYLAAKEDIKMICYKKEKEIRAKKMYKDFDETMKVVNGQKRPKMVKA